MDFRRGTGGSSALRTSSLELTQDLVLQLQVPLVEGKCFRCKKSGHMKRECPENSKSKPSNY